MGKVVRVGSLELDQDPAQERKEWVFERLGWTAMGLLLLAGLTGAFGHGPLSAAEARDAAGTLQVSYPRLSRHQAPSQLVFRLNPPPGEAAELWISRSYLDGLDIQRIVPEPAEAQAGPERVVFRFRRSDPTAPARVTFDVTPNGYGQRHGEVGLSGGPGVAIAEFVFP